MSTINKIKGRPRTEDEKENRRVAVLDATAKMIAEDAYASTKAADIGSEVGLPPRELQDLFQKNRRDPLEVKQRIVIELFERMWKEFLEITDSELSRMPSAKSASDVKDCLENLFRRMVARSQEFGPKIKTNSGLWGSWGIIFIMESRTPETRNVEAGYGNFVIKLDEALTIAQKNRFLPEGNIPALRQELIGCGENILVGWFWGTRRESSYPANYTLNDGIYWFRKVLDGLIIDPKSLKRVRGRRKK